MKRTSILTSNLKPLVISIKNSCDGVVFQDLGHQNDRCSAFCTECNKTPACDKTVELIECQSCIEDFSCVYCLKNYEGKQCKKFEKCPKCIFRYEVKRLHVCGKYYCGEGGITCSESTYYCYIKTLELSELQRRDRVDKITIV